MSKKPKFLQKKSQEPKEEENTSPEENEEDLQETIAQEREFFLNEGNYRMKHLTMLKIQQDMMETLLAKMDEEIELFKKFGQMMEDSMDEGDD